MTEDVRLRDGSGPSARRRRTVDETHGRGETRVHGTAYAALDLGTNNCRLLIARVSNDGFRVIKYLPDHPAGRGSRPRLVGDTAISRAVGALGVCGDKIHTHERREAAAHHCRRSLHSADDADHFLDLIERETGIKLEVIDRETKSTLAAIGCSPLLIPRPKEQSCLQYRRRLNRSGRIERPAGQPHDAPVKGPWVSLPLGVVTLAERFRGYECDAQVYGAMVAEVRVISRRSPNSMGMVYLACTCSAHPEP